MSRILAFAGIFLAASACDSPAPVSPTVPDGPLFAQAPADGNGNKLVFSFDETFPVNCGAQTLDLNIRSWVQIRVLRGSGNRNIELDVFHGVLTYTNSVGQSFVWHDVGPDRYSVVNGEVIVAVVGTSTASGTNQRDQIVIGRMVLNLSTGDVQFIAGQELGRIDDLACAELT